jgi:arginine decarboxylase
MGWTIDDSAELYSVRRWGQRLFDINEAGHLVVEPAGVGRGQLDLFELSGQLRERGIALPAIVRMPQVAARRMRLLVESFDKAFAAHGYQGRYRGVYPIKVNQQRRLVEELLEAGRAHHFGLEAGSKPELLIALAMLNDPDALLVCNGYKDRWYVETALMARQLGRNTILVLEKGGDLPLILEAAERLGVEPVLGVRARLSSPGKGRWSDSAGDRAKFGLSAQGIVQVVERLRAAGKLHWLKLLHFHIGSQVTSIRTFKHAVREAARLYTELCRLGADMGTIDVGGGLAVDYDGSRTDFESSRNYSVSEYAADLVNELTIACDAAGLPHPDLVTESGRATVAHCSVLLFDIVGAERVPSEGEPDPPSPDDPPILTELQEVWGYLTDRNYQEVWHDASDIRERSKRNFEMGLLSLEGLAAVERLYWRLCARILRITRRQRYVPDDLDGLEPALADTYYGNFSVFQSAPDSWALDQLFPCLPVHRLDEKPMRRAVIADLTCDSDGKLQRFVDLRDVKRVLELHTLRPGERYVLALPLVGAYQEILGGMHNLFGRTNAVHVVVDASGEPRIDRLIAGADVASAVFHVAYDSAELLEKVQWAASAKRAEGQLSEDDERRVVQQVRAGLAGYTYLDPEAGISHPEDLRDGSRL